MNWRAEPGAFRCPPYVVVMSGPRWIARMLRPGSFPDHLGTFNSANEAKAACLGHKQARADAWESAGFGEK